VSQSDARELKPGRTETYTVVARRYRPQRFEDVVGQEHVVRSLRNAIRLNRVAQAYLFCGTRGVGKTSVARIFAKCLNCVKGPSEQPCDACDICQSIALGQDVDVIEIDGASNNGVEQVRELRQNVGLRPSRGRFKIYYIDEVHMLTPGAFNALLKTLEEPPPHVKFFFATTEPGKIPVTVLSRCQRFDFAGISPEAIATALAELCVRERALADPDALRVLARRAGGSLRDAQSLLDRLLASGSTRLTVELVHSLLGTASDERLLSLLEALAGRDAAGALLLLGDAVKEGVQPADLLGGLIEFFRDALVMSVGAESLLLAVTPRQQDRLKRIVEKLSVDTIQAALEILGACRMRMRGSPHGQLILEMGLVRIVQLENLTALGPLIERLRALDSGPIGMRRHDADAARATAGLTRSAAPDPVTTPGPGQDPRPAPAAPAPVQKPRPRGPATEAPVSETASPQCAAPIAVAPEAPETARGAGRTALAGARAPVAAAAPESATGRTLSPGGPPRDPAGPLLRETPAPPATAPAAAAAIAPEQPHTAPRAREAAADPAAPHPPADLPPLQIALAKEVWPSLIRRVGGGLGWRLSQVEPVTVEGSDLLVISSKPGYNSVADSCGTPEALRRIAHALQRLLNRPVNLRYERATEDGESPAEARQSEKRRAEALLSDPMIQQVVELFEARPVQLELLRPEEPDEAEANGGEG
jgi:DNA polymerase-3 subunit gamma/tau